MQVEFYLQYFEDVLPKLTKKDGFKINILNYYIGQYKTGKTIKEDDITITVEQDMTKTKHKDSLKMFWPFILKMDIKKATEMRDALTYIISQYGKKDLVVRTIKA